MLLGIEIGEGFTIRLQLIQIRQQVVTINVGDLQVETQRLENFLNLQRHAPRIQTPGVGNDFDVLFAAKGCHILNLLQEGADIAGILTAGLLLVVQNRHGELGKIIPCEHVDGPTFDHFSCGI